jgi:hypothetical protein
VSCELKDSLINWLIITPVVVRKSIDASTDPRAHAFFSLSIINGPEL